MADTDWGTWVTFYSAGASAAAALTGLVFVSISINLSRVLAIPGMSARGGEAITLLGVAVLSCLLSLIPGQSLHALGWEIGPVALLAWVLPLLLHWRTLYKRHFQHLWHVLLRVVLHQASTLPVLIASHLLVMQHEDARYWLAGGILLTLVAGMFSAWVLMVEIAR